MKHTKKVDQIQHGDVLLKRIPALPGEALPVSRRGPRLVVAEGEATGHAHIITDVGAGLWTLKGELYLEVTAPVTITHDEHKALPIPEGIYRIGKVKEYDYFQEAERNVSD